MTMAKAYDDYLVSIREGWSYLQAVEHACYCWDVDRDDLMAYIRSFQ